MSEVDTAAMKKAEKAYIEYVDNHGLMASQVSAQRENPDESFSLMIEVATFTGTRDLYKIPMTNQLLQWLSKSISEI